MSYTNAELVRQHVANPLPVKSVVRDQSVALSGSDFISFFGGAVDPSSLRVKAVRTTLPRRIQVILAETPVGFSQAPVVQNSVAVASDTSLGTIYTENVDYLIDYLSGTIIPKSGELSASDAVVVWCVPFTLYVAGVDYVVDDQRGRIKRLAGGSIADGETVILDYLPLDAHLSDSLIEHAVTMANGMIESEVDPARQFEADRSLESAATYRALEIVCRAAAGRELSRQCGEDRPALAWLKLAEDYRTRADAMIDSFRPPADKLRPPTRT